MHFSFLQQYLIIQYFVYPMYIISLVCDYYLYLFMNNSGSINREFTVLMGNDQLTVHLNMQKVKVNLMQSKMCEVYQEVYTQKNLPSNQKQLYKNSQQLFAYLEALKQSNHIWSLKDSSKIIIQYSKNDYITLSLKKVTDQQQLSRMLVQELLKTKKSNNYTRNETLQQISIIKNIQETYQKDLAVRLKGIGEIIQSFHQNLDQKTSQINTINKSICQIQQSSSKKIKQQNLNSNKAHSQSNGDSPQGIIEQQISILRTELQIVQKTMNRNILTFKEQFSQYKFKTQKSISDINDQIKRYNFPKIKEESLMIIESFNTQIRIKEYQFIPSAHSLSLAKKICFLNRKIVKNLEDAKDYNKIRSQLPIPYGIYKIRILIKNLKNNGLLFGVCNNKVMDTLQKISFNDHNLISFNSCGYIINRGLMMMSNGRIKNGDIVKMIVDIPRGQIRWSCNDIEVALADFGTMKKEGIYPILGLGFFGDQVEIIQNEASKEQEIRSNQSYKQQLAKINQKYKPFKYK